MSPDWGKILKGSGQQSEPGAFFRGTWFRKFRFRIRASALSQGTDACPKGPENSRALKTRGLGGPNRAGLSLAGSRPLSQKVQLECHSGMRSPRNYHYMVVGLRSNWTLSQTHGRIQKVQNPKVNLILFGYPHAFYLYLYGPYVLVLRLWCIYFLDPPRGLGGRQFPRLGLEEAQRWSMLGSGKPLGTLCTIHAIYDILCTIYYLPYTIYQLLSAMGFAELGLQLEHGSNSC